MRPILFSLSNISKISTSKGEVVTLYSRNKFGRRVVHTVNGHEPYFYVKDHLDVPLDQAITNITGGFKSYDYAHGTKRIYTKSALDVANGDYDGVRYYFHPDDCYEDDVKYVKRWLIDSGILLGYEVDDASGVIDFSQLKPVDNFSVPLKVNHFDIETYLQPGFRFSEPEHILASNMPITSISNINSYKSGRVSLFSFHPILIKEDCVLEDKIQYGNSSEYDYVRYLYTSEYKMLTAWVDYMSRSAFDGLTAWNGLAFDIPYTISRCIKLGVDVTPLSPVRKVYRWGDSYEITGVSKFDSMLMYKRFQTKATGVGLNDTGNRVLGYGKVPHKKSLNWLFVKNPSYLHKYNAVDVILDYEISMKEKTFQTFQDFKAFVGCEYDDLMSNSRMVDMLFLRRAKAKGICLPSKRDRVHIKKRGAHVPIPRVLGKSYCVFSLDLTSLYPTIMICFNMGNDTISSDGEIITPSGGPRFKREFISFISEILGELLDYRNNIRYVEMPKLDKVKDADEYDRLNRLQTIVKFITNSIFGVMAFSSFRLYNPDIAGAILSTARWIIKDTARVCEKLGYRLLYGDTDSVFVFSRKTLDGDGYDAVVKDGLELQVKLNEYYQNYSKIFNLFTNKFNIKLEKVWRIIRMRKIRDKNKTKAAKKSYYGYIVYDEGTEYRTGPGEFKVTGLERSDNSIIGAKVLDRVMRLDAMNSDSDAILNYIAEEVANMRNGKYTLADMARKEGLGRKLSEYSAKAQNRMVPRAVRFTLRNAMKWGGRCSIDVGSKVRLFHMHKDRIPIHYDGPEDVVALDDFDYLPPDLIECINWEMHIEKTIYMKVRQVIDDVDVSLEVGSLI